MPWLIGSRLLFLHIPKTGGDFITHATKAFRHGPMHGHEIPSSRTAERRDTFTIVRQPSAWLISLWGHLERSGSTNARPGHTMGEPMVSLLQAIGYERGVDLYSLFQKAVSPLGMTSILEFFQLYTRNADFILEAGPEPNIGIQVVRLMRLLEDPSLTDEMNDRLRRPQFRNAMPANQWPSIPCQEGFRRLEFILDLGIRTKVWGQQ